MTVESMAAEQQGAVEGMALRGSVESARPSLRGLVGWTLFILLLGYVVLLGGSYLGIQSTTLRTFSLLLIAAALVAWAVAALLRPAWRPRTAIWPALVLPLGTLALTTLTSPFPRLGLDYLAWAMLLVALYLVLVRIMAVPLARAWVGGLAAAVGLALGLLYIALVVERWLEWWDLLGRVTAPMLRPAYQGLFLGGPTLVAPVLVLFGVVAAGGLDLRRRSRRALLVALAIVILVGVVLAASRASWLGIAVAAAVVGIGLAVQGRAAIASALHDRRLRLAIAGVVIVALLGLVVLGPALVGRLALGGDGGRSAYATTAMRMFEQAPLLGQGPGTWAPRRLAFTEAGESDFIVPHAHNVYAQTLAETGILGIVVGVVAIGAVLWLLDGGIRDGDARRRRWSWAALFGLVYLGVHGLFDSYANVPLVMLLAAIPVAVVDATSSRGIRLPLLRPGTPSARRVNAAASIALFLAAAVAIATLYRVEAVAAMHQRAVDAVHEGDWPVALSAARSAAAEDPAMVPYHVTLGLAASAARDWPAAEAAFERAVRVDDQPEAWLDLALARLESGRPTDAVAAAVEAGLRTGRGHPDLLLAAGFLYDRLGLHERADQAYADALAIEPSLAADPAWDDLLGSPDRAGGILEMAMERSDAPWELALMADQPERARELASALDEAWLASTVIEAWTGDEAALAELQSAAAERPTDTGLVVWAARASANAGDDEQAARFRRVSDFHNEDRVPRGYEPRIVRSGESIPGVVPAPHLYGSFLYRRPTPGSLLAEGLPRVVLSDPGAAA